MDAASARIYRGASWHMPLLEKRPVPDRIRDDLFRIMRRARVAELVDAHDSKSCSARSGGSIPSTGTNRSSQMFAPALPARSLPATLVCRGIGRLLR